jgi:RNA polymerase sigma factor (sigma-70 family)
MSDPDGLLERFIKDRSNEAFKALVDRHGAMVAATCRRVLGNEAEAEDAAQAVFFILARKAGSVASGDALGPWLHRVAVRVACEMKRKRQLRDHHEDQAAGQKAHAEVQRPSDEEVSKIKAAVDEEIDALPEKLRLPVVACLVDHKSVSQAAKELGLTDGQVRGRLERAREKLRVALTGRGINIAPVVVPVLLGEVLCGDPLLATGLGQKLLAVGAHVLGGAKGAGAGLSSGVVSLAESVTVQLVKAKMIKGFLVACLAGGIVAASALGAAWAVDAGGDGGRISGPSSVTSTFPVGAGPGSGVQTPVTRAYAVAIGSGAGSGASSGASSGVSSGAMPASLPPSGVGKGRASLRGRTVSGAGVEVLHYQPMALTTEPEKEGERSLSHGWLRVPGFLSQGATIYSLEPKEGSLEPNHEAGVSTFRAMSDGVVMIFCAYGYQGNKTGEWTKDVRSAKDLVQEGWEGVGMAVSRYGREFTVFAREVKKGEVFRIRCNKYEPPYVVVKETVRIPEEMESEFPSARAKETPVQRRAAVVNAWVVGRVWGFSAEPVAVSPGPWVEMPEEIRGARIFSKDGRNDGGGENDAHHGGAADFEVQRDGVVFIAGQLDQREGNLEGDWDEHRLTVKNFEEAGWAFVGSMKDDKGVSYAVFRKGVLNGERYRIRTNKYTPTYVIVKP